jgi:FkbM family methyltransferase
MHIPLMNPIDWAIQNKQLFFNKFLPSPGCVMIDIGAGAGTEIVFLSKAVGVEGRIFAVEPDDQAFRRLNKMVQLNQLDNVSTYKLALSSIDQSVNFNHASDYGVDNFISETEHLNSQKVEAQSLTTFIEQNQIYSVDFVKMNIEGAEVKVLEGLKDKIFDIKNWCISCHDFLGREGTDTYFYVKSWLVDSGYEVSGYSGVIAKSAPHLSFYLFAGNRTN